MSFRVGSKAAVPSLAVSDMGWDGNRVLQQVFVGMAEGGREAYLHQVIRFFRPLLSAVFGYADLFAAFQTAVTVSRLSGVPLDMPESAKSWGPAINLDGFKELVALVAAIQYPVLASRFDKLLAELRGLPLPSPVAWPPADEPFWAHMFGAAFQGSILSNNMRIKTMFAADSGTTLSVSSDLPLIARVGWRALLARAQQAGVAPGRLPVTALKQAYLETLQNRDVRSVTGSVLATGKALGAMSASLARTQSKRGASKLKSISEAGDGIPSASSSPRKTTQVGFDFDAVSVDTEDDVAEDTDEDAAQDGDVELLTSTLTLPMYTELLVRLTLAIMAADEEKERVSVAEKARAVRIAQLAGSANRFRQGDQPDVSSEGEDALAKAAAVPVFRRAQGIGMNFTTLIHDMSDISSRGDSAGPGRPVSAPSAKPAFGISALGSNSVRNVLSVLGQDGSATARPSSAVTARSGRPWSALSRISSGTDRPGSALSATSAIAGNKARPWSAMSRPDSARTGGSNALTARSGTSMVSTASEKLGSVVDLLNVSTNPYEELGIGQPMAPLRDVSTLERLKMPPQPKGAKGGAKPAAKPSAGGKGGKGGKKGGPPPLPPQPMFSPAQQAMRAHHKSVTTAPQVAVAGALKTQQAAPTTAPVSLRASVSLHQRLANMSVMACVAPNASGERAKSPTPAELSASYLRPPGTTFFVDAKPGSQLSPRSLSPRSPRQPASPGRAGSSGGPSAMSEHVGEVPVGDPAGSAGVPVEWRPSILMDAPLPRPDNAPAVAAVQLEASIQYQNNRDYDMAVACVVAAEQAWKTEPTWQEEAVVYCLLRRASIHLSAGEFDEAMEALLTAHHRVDEFEQGLALGAVFHSLGCVVFEMHQFEVAARCFALALKARQDVLGPDDADTALSKHNLAACLLMEGEVDEALLAFTQAHRTFCDKLGASNLRALAADRNLSRARAFASQQGIAGKSKLLLMRADRGKLCTNAQYFIKLGALPAGIAAALASGGGGKKKKGKKKGGKKKK